MMISLLRRWTRPVALVAAVHLVQALALLHLPTLNADVIDNGVLTGDTGYVLGRGALMLVATVAQATCAAVAVYLGARVGMGVGADLRAATFTHVQRFSAREFSRFGTPSLITRTTNDVQQVQVLVFTTLSALLSAPFLAVGGVVLASRLDVPLSGVLLVAIPVAAAAMVLIIRRMTPPSRLTQVRTDAVNRVLREQITGVRVIRAFVRDAHERRRFAGANGDLMAVALRLGRLQAFSGASALLVINLAAIAVVAFGGPRVLGGDLRVGALVAFLGYLAQILMSVMVAMTVFEMLPRARVSMDRITEVLATQPSVPEPGKRGYPSGPGDLDVRGVSFGYPGAENAAVRGVDLVARPGQTTAIVGSTGAGKTTLVNLLARLIDVDSGSVSINGMDVRQLDRVVLSRLVGLVPQRSYLFSGTIASNLRYGSPDATDDELWHALEVAQARDFVAAMPEGLDTPVAQGGTTVSGGQRQRLAIARALVGRHQIYLFDDAFSALDAATDAALRAALAKEIGDATVVVVAQRLSSIRSADRIVVLDAGLVEAVGTHAELSRISPTYQEILRSQGEK
nr:ABC transporter ATP-binding protein [Actinokineospora globicatena]